MGSNDVLWLGFGGWPKKDSGSVESAKYDIIFLFTCTYILGVFSWILISGQKDPDPKHCELKLWENEV